jgi:hypothetical protein
MTPSRARVFQGRQGLAPAHKTQRFSPRDGVDAILKDDPDIRRLVRMTLQGEDMDVYEVIRGRVVLSKSEMPSISSR